MEKKFEYCGDCNGVTPGYNDKLGHFCLCAYLPLIKEGRTSGGTKVNVRTGNAVLTMRNGRPLKHKYCKYKGGGK